MSYCRDCRPAFEKSICYWLVRLCCSKWVTNLSRTIFTYRTKLYHFIDVGWSFWFKNFVVWCWSKVENLICNYGSILMGKLHVGFVCLKCPFWYCGKIVVKAVGYFTGFVTVWPFIWRCTRMSVFDLVFLSLFITYQQAFDFLSAWLIWAVVCCFLRVFNLWSYSPIS